MSMYTRINVELALKKPLENSGTLKEKIQNHCGAKDFFITNNQKIEMEVTFNYGYQKMVDVLKECKKLIYYMKPTKVGTFSTEEIWSYYMTEVYAYLDDLYIVNYEPEVGYGYECHHYTITNLEGTEQSFSYYSNEINPPTIQEFIEQIAKK